MPVWNDVRIIQANLDPDVPLIVPSYKGNVNPGSYDLMLGQYVRLPHPIWSYLTKPDLQMLIANQIPQDAFKRFHLDYGHAWDLYDLVQKGEGDNHLLKLPKWGEEQDLGVGGGLWVYPKEFVLCHSIEYVNLPDDVISFLFSKSSTGRVGLEHLHAGLGDGGWEGQWVFEFHVVAPWPLFLQVGKRIMQMVVIDMTGLAAEPYRVKGKYNKQLRAVPSRNKEV